jgi:hypothetical protein
VTTATSFSFVTLGGISPTNIGASSILTIVYEVSLPTDTSCEMVIVGPSEVDLISKFSTVTG